MTTYNDATVAYSYLFVPYNGEVPAGGVQIDEEYRVQVFAMGANFAVGSLVAEVDTAMHVIWAKYVNDVDEMAFTMHQDDPKASTVASYIDKAHVRVWRGNELVFQGLLLDTDEMGDDVVFYGYGYLAALYFLLSEFNVTFDSVQIDTIVSSLWTRAKTTLSSSLLAHVLTGVIQAPVTTSGGSTAIVLDEFVLYRKRILFALQELATLAMSDTTNMVIFEITHSTAPTFHLWKNKGSTIDTVMFEYGDGRVLGFQRQIAGMSRRNVLYGHGYTPRDTLLQTTQEDATSRTTYGRREEPLLLSWVRDQDELERVIKRRLQISKQGSWDLMLNLAPESIVPPTLASSPLALGDKVRVKISRGVTSIDEDRRLVGVMVTAAGGMEYVRPLLKEIVGS